MTAVEQTGRRFRVHIGAQGDHQDVGVERALSGVDVLGHRIDGGYLGLHDLHTGLGDVGVPMENRVLGRPPEHHVEFRESEDEAVLAIDQNDVGGITELLRQLGGEFESAEPCTQDNNAHGPTLSRIHDQFHGDRRHPDRAVGRPGVKA